MSWLTRQPGGSGGFQGSGVGHGGVLPGEGRLPLGALVSLWQPPLELSGLFTNPVPLCFGD